MPHARGVVGEVATGPAVQPCPAQDLVRRASGADLPLDRRRGLGEARLLLRREERDADPVVGVACQPLGLRMLRRVVGVEEFGDPLEVADDDFEDVHVNLLRSVFVGCVSEVGDVLNMTENNIRVWSRNI